MDEMKNVLKEIDLQVVYRRLEERKKNITNDGKLSRKQLAAAYRGWYGVEAKCHALKRLSDENMTKTENKNQKISQQHDQDMKQMLQNEKFVKEESSKAIKALRNDFTSLLAYQYVYKTHSLKNVEKAREDKNTKQLQRPYSDRYDQYEVERKSAVSRGPRPLGSLREIENYRNELKIKFPSLEKTNDNKEEEKIPINMLGEKQYERPNTDKSQNKAFPNIEHAMGVEIKYRIKVDGHSDVESFHSAPGEVNRDGSVFRSDTKTPVTEFDMGQNLLRMRRLEQEKVEKRRILPSTPNVLTKSEAQIAREYRKRKLPSIPTARCTKIYPAGAKNSNDMKKFISREATEILESWSRDPKRLEIYEKEVGFDTNRPKTTSDMFRQLQRLQEQNTILKERRENDKSIIVRQLTPLPRPGSPVSIRMTEYSSRISSPLPLRERSPSFKPKRENSEKIPSVSRTSSYKELPDGPIELHENALLTAAERIEKEKLLREQQKLEEELNMAKVTVNQIKTGVTNQETIKRKLPDVITKKPFPHTSLDRSWTVFHKKYPEIGSKSDVETINKVSNANLTTEEFDRKQHPRAISTADNSSDQYNKQLWKVSDSLNIDSNSFVLERGAYSPLSRKSEPIKRRLTPISDVGISDQFDRISSFSGKPVLGKLSNKSHFNYDNFSRVPPDAKKRLELRAKNRRKMQLQNAKLDEERRQENDLLANTERPSTRVSFNEKVVVFQTI